MDSKLSNPVIKSFIPLLYILLLINSPLIISQTGLNEYPSKIYPWSQPGIERINKSALPYYKGSDVSVNSGSTSAEPKFSLLGNFGNNILNSFKGNNIYLHLGAVAATYLLVTQNVDYHVEHFFNTHEQYGQWARPVVISGSLLPFIVGGSLFSYAEIKNDNEVLGASFAVIQASVIELLYNSALKAITGRAHPDWRHNSDMQSLSKDFRFGFLRGGVFWGWPSGHTSATMAVVSALTNYYPHSTWLKIAGFSLVAYTIFGVSSVNRGGMHWFSDAVAAALMSYAVGSTVGKYYRSLYSGSDAPAAGSSKEVISPDISPLGISFTLMF